jgi:hypothetical protein
LRPSLLDILLILFVELTTDITYPCATNILPD